MYKNAIYSVFGTEADNAVKDLTDIYESIISLKEHDGIVTIFNNVISLFTNYDYSFDFDAYINDEAYLEAFNKKLTDLLNELLNEADNTFNFILGFEEDLENIAKALDSFTTKYFGTSFDINEYVNYLFDMLYMYEITDDMIVIYQRTIKDMVENVLRTILEDVYEFYGEADDLLNYVCQTLDESVFNIIGLITNFDDVVDLDAYLNNEEYRVEYNQKLLNLAYDLIDEYVLLYNGVLSTEESFVEFAEYCDNLVDKYIGENRNNMYLVGIEISYMVQYLFKELGYYQLSEEQIADVKLQVESFINEKLATIIVDIYDISDEVMALFYELYNDLALNGEEVLQIVTTLALSYYESYNYYLNNGMWHSESVQLALEDLYKEHMDLVDELCYLLKEIVKTSDTKLIKTIDEKLVKICDLVGLNLEYSLEDVYSDLLVLIELLKSLEDFVGNQNIPDISDPNINLEDVIIPN